MFKFSYNHYLPLLLLVLVSSPSCSKLPSFLAGGGPNVAANVQAGKTNSQTLGTTNNTASSVSVKPDAKVNTIDQSNNSSQVLTERADTVVVNEVPTWLILVFGLLCGFLIPSPAEIVRGLLGTFKS